MRVSRRNFLAVAGVGLAGAALEVGSGVSFGATTTSTGWWPGTGLAGDPHEPDVVVARALPDSNTRFPHIERLADGRLAVVYYDATSHGRTNGRIAMVTSDDNSRTWSTPRIIMDTDLDDLVPRLTQLRSGDLLLKWYRTDWWRTPRYPKVMGTFVSRSSDAGLTWSDPVKVGTKMDGPSDLNDGVYELGQAASEGPILELPNGDLIVGLYGETPDRKGWQTTVVRSADGGHSWPVESEVQIGISDTIQYLEPTFAIGPTGVISCLQRIPGRGNTSRESFSHDNGYSWTEPVPTVIDGQAAHLLTTSSGMTLAVFGDDSFQFNRSEVVVGRLRKRDQTWADTVPIQLYDGGVGVDQGEPHSIELSPNNFLTVSYDASRGIILGKYSRQSDYLFDE